MFPAANRGSAPLATGRWLAVFCVIFALAFQTLTSAQLKTEPGAKPSEQQPSSRTFANENGEPVSFDAGGNSLRDVESSSHYRDDDDHHLKMNEEAQEWNGLLSPATVGTASARAGQAVLNSLRGFKSQPAVKGQRLDEGSEKAGKPEASDDSLSPVILVPGYGGSRLEGKRNKAHVKHYFCEKVSDWSNFWIDLKLMLPYMIDCLIDDFRLEFDYKTNLTHNSQGIEMRVRNPDDVGNVEFLTDIHLSTLGYFAPIIRRLTTALGYRRNHNIRGAPYDFRKAPNELGDYFAKLKRDSENLRAQFNGQRVTYICHSMGCNNILYFLQRQSQTWKDQHVRRVISLAAPWGGSMQAVRATVFGDNLGLPYLFDEAELKIVQQSVPSTMYLYPSERAFKNSPLIRFNTNSKEAAPETLAAADFKRFFDKISHPSGYLMWLNTRDLLGKLEAPQVEVQCLYGQGKPTLGRMEFRGDFPSSQEEPVYDDGDGTVTVQSSAFCKQWGHEQAKPIHARPLHVGHVDILRDSEVLDAIEDILRQTEKPAS